MDVTCDRCKAEYEFDEALLGEKGTTVKCSSCGHVFRVMPPDREVGRAQLRLRYAKDGSVQKLGSLRELQQRIRAGEVSLDDELGRDGFPFRALRDVPELKNFFARSPEKTTVKPDPQGMATAPTEVVRTAPARASFDEAPVTAKMKPEMLLGALPTARKTPVPTTGAGSSAPAHVPSARAEPRSATPREPEVMRVPAARVPAEPWPDPRMHRGEPKVPVAARTQRASVPPATDPPSPEAVARAAPKPAQRTMLGVGPNASGAGSNGQPTSSPADRDAADAAPSSPTANSLGVPAPGRAAAAHRPAPSGTLGPPAAMAARASQAAEATREPARENAGPRPNPTLLGGPQGRDFGLNGGPAPSGPVFAPPEAHDAPHGSTALNPPASPIDPAAAAASAAVRFPISEHNRSVEPTALPRFPISDAARTVEPAGASRAAPVRLYVDDDDAAPSRAQAGSGKMLWIVLGVALLGGAGWVGMNVIRQQGARPANSTVVPDPALAPAAPQAATSEDAAVAASPAVPAASEPAPQDAPAGTEDEATAAGAQDQATRAAKRGKADEDETEPREKADTSRGEPEKSARERRGKSGGSAEPSDYSGWVARGDQLTARGDQDGAGKAYRAALALRPAGSEANSGLGFALLGQGQAREALPYFDRAASSGFAEANVGLGDAYRKLGQNSSAVEAYKTYLERLPTGSRVNYVQGWIDKLDKSGRSSSAPAQDNSYRPAGELNEPSVPSAPANAPAPVGPSEPPQ